MVISARVHIIIRRREEARDLAHNFVYVFDIEEKGTDRLKCVQELLDNLQNQTTESNIESSQYWLTEIAITLH